MPELTADERQAAITRAGEIMVYAQAIVIELFKADADEESVIAFCDLIRQRAGAIKADAQSN